MVCLVRPGPGVGLLEELAMGIRPKVGTAGPIRRRSGMLQLAFGPFVTKR